MVARAAGRRHRIQHASAQDRGLMAAKKDKLEIVPERTVEVRETRKLFRLAPAVENDGSCENPFHRASGLIPRTNARQTTRFPETFSVGRGRLNGRIRKRR
jgi:hypothetical protein